MVRFAVLGPVAGAVLVLNLRCGAFGGPRFGEQEMKAAVEGTWQLTIGEPAVGGESGAEQADGERIVTFRIEQGRKPRHAGARSALVRSAEACGTRSLVRAAEACVDVTRMPLDVTLIAGAEQRRAELGEMVVLGEEFERGRIEVALGGVRLDAEITARGEVREVASRGGDGRELPSRLVRIAQ